MPNKRQADGPSARASMRYAGVTAAGPSLSSTAALLQRMVSDAKNPIHQLAVTFSPSAQSAPAPAQQSQLDAPAASSQPTNANPSAASSITMSFTALLKQLLLASQAARTEPEADQTAQHAAKQTSRFDFSYVKSPEAMIAELTTSVQALQQATSVMGPRGNSGPVQDAAKDLNELLNQISVMIDGAHYSAGLSNASLAPAAVADGAVSADVEEKDIHLEQRPEPSLEDLLEQQLSQQRQLDAAPEPEPEPESSLSSAPTPQPSASFEPEEPAPSYTSPTPCSTSLVPGGFSR